jgi:hypothetical protein
MALIVALVVDVAVLHLTSTLLEPIILASCLLAIELFVDEVVTYAAELSGR